MGRFAAFPNPLKFAPIGLDSLVHSCSPHRYVQLFAFFSESLSNILSYLPPLLQANSQQLKTFFSRRFPRRGSSGFFRFALPDPRWGALGRANRPDEPFPIRGPPKASVGKSRSVSPPGMRPAPPQGCLDRRLRSFCAPCVKWFDGFGPHSRNSRHS
jgi:hypothetical protein